MPAGWTAEWTEMDTCNQEGNDTSPGFSRHTTPYGLPCCILCLADIQWQYTSQAEVLSGTTPQKPVSINVI